MKTLSGKVALVTGGSRGIGAAIVKRLAELGADVALSYSASPDAAQKVAAEARALGVRAEAFKADAADPAAVRKLVTDTVAKFGKLDILVNNAGIFLMGMLPDATEAEFDKLIAVNVKAVFVATQEAAKHMKSGGRIVNLSSIVGVKSPYPGLSLYSMSKFGVEGLTRGFAQDLAPAGITVNAVQPGPIDTDMNPDGTDMAAGMKQGVPMKRYGKAEEVAAAVAFLVSPEASYTTGGSITVDGGMIA